MSASAAARSLFGFLWRRLFFARRGWQRGCASIRLERASPERREYLAPVGLHRHPASLGTGKRYGSRSPYFIPPTFLYKLRSGVTPHVCQIVALSESTGYRFVDWMRMFGFDLHQIPRLQVQLHTERTVLVTPIELKPPLSGHGLCAHLLPPSTNPLVVPP